jgi:hypothetical protein
MVIFSTECVAIACKQTAIFDGSWLSAGFGGVCRPWSRYVSKGYVLVWLCAHIDVNAICYWQTNCAGLTVCILLVRLALVLRLFHPEPCD